MSKKSGLKDISKRSRSQNVQEKQFKGHFEALKQSKCPRKTIQWTFQTKMSSQNVQ
jgi:hypothetical protein